MIRYFNKSKIIYIILFILILFILFLIYLNYINIELIDNLLEVEKNKYDYNKQYKTYINYAYIIAEYLHPLTLLLYLSTTDNYIEFIKELVFDNFTSFSKILFENFVDNNLAISDKEDFIKIRNYKYH